MISTTTVNPNGSSVVIVFNANGTVTTTTTKSNGSVSVTTSTSLSIPTPSIDVYDVSWGKWNNPVDDNFVIVTKVENEITLIGAGDYLAQVNPAPIANLQGSHSYATGIASSFLGGGTAGEISSLVASMEVNFDSGSINNGSLQLLVSDQTWSVSFEGSVQHGFVDLQATSGSLLDGSAIISNSIGANLGGVFTGNNGEAFVGGFDLVDQINSLNSVSGLFTIER